MARTAATFANHQILGAFPVPVDGVSAPSAEGLTSTPEKITASDIVRAADGKTVDENASRSGEVEIQVYKADTLEAALALFGGSEADLVKAAVDSYNNETRDKAKRHIVTTIEGPEKVVMKALERLAKHFDTDVATLRAKVDANPAYLDMLLNLAK